MTILYLHITCLCSFLISYTGAVTTIFNIPAHLKTKQKHQKAPAVRHLQQPQLTCDVEICPTNAFPWLKLLSCKLLPQLESLTVIVWMTSQTSGYAYSSESRAHMWQRASSLDLKPLSWWKSYAPSRPLGRIGKILLALSSSIAAVERTNKAYSLQ